jgi:hypothetical protein
MNHPVFPQVKTVGARSGDSSGKGKKRYEKLLLAFPV